MQRLDALAGLDVQAVLRSLGQRLSWRGHILHWYKGVLADPLEGDVLEKTDGLLRPPSELLDLQLLIVIKSGDILLALGQLLLELRVFLE